MGLALLTCSNMFQHVPTCSKLWNMILIKTHGLFGSEHLQFRSSIAALDAGKSFAAASCGGIDGLPGRCRELSTSGGEQCERCAFKSEESGEKEKSIIFVGIYPHSITIYDILTYMYIFEMYILYFSRSEESWQHAQPGLSTKNKPS